MVGQTKTDLKVTEFSAGVGGQLTPNFRVGAAWRLVNVSADMAFLSETNLGGDSVLLNLQAKGLTAQAADAFRLGAQYESTDKSWGLGAMYRSEVFFRAQGKSGGQREFRTGGTRATAGFSGVAQMTEGNVQIQSTFPQQLNVGGFYGDVGKWKVLGEYSWTQYSVNDILDVSGEVGVPNLLGTIATVSNSLNTADLELKWNDQHLYRLGFEKYCEDNLTLRAGFAYTTIVTPDFRAKQTFSTPGAVKAVSLGAGKTFGSWDHNLAGEYTWVSATGSNVLDSTEGTFSSNAYTFHWGSTYRF
jgi:long-subunit fatty acid transport protein